MILVAGARGSVGAPLATALAAGGQPVRALTRSADPGGLPAGIAAVRGDLDNPDEVAAALQGVRRVALCAGGFGLAERTRTVVAAATTAGVERIVLVTSLGVEAGTDDPVVAANAGAEAGVRAFAGDWTILRPGALDSDVLRWSEPIRAGRPVGEPHAAVRFAAVDPRDVAEVAARALTEPGHAGRIHRITGPEALTAAEQATVLGSLLGRAVTFHELSAEAARAELRRYLPADIADALLDQAANEGPWSEPLSTVYDVTGRAARSFRDWAADHLPLFR